MIIIRDEYIHFRTKTFTKILPFLTAILRTRRLQPPRDDCAVPVQWFSSVGHRPVKVFLSFEGQKTPKWVLQQTVKPQMMRHFIRVYTVAKTKSIFRERNIKLFGNYNL